MAFWKNLGRSKQLRHKEQNKGASGSSKTHSTKPIFAGNGDLGDSLVNELSPTPSILSSMNDSKENKEDATIGDLGDFCDTATQKPRLRKSRLSKNLAQVLSDPAALSNFQQYMDCRDSASCLAFLNDVRNFNMLASMGSPDEKDFFTYPTMERYKTLMSPPNSNSTSSSSGFGDDFLLDSPADHSELLQVKSCLETETLTHSLHSEALRIFQKYFEPESSNFLASISEEQRTLVKDKLIPEHFTLDCFSQVQQFLWNLLEAEHFPDYLHSEFYHRHQMDILTSGKLNLNDVLYSDTALFYFMEFMDQEGKRHWLEFWLAADNFRQQWSQDQAATDALVIYNRYFSLQATQPLGLSDSIRSRVEENICRAVVPAPDCFEYALQAVLTITEKHYLPLFLCSQCYLQYLTEVIATVKTNASSLYHRKRTGSESTLNSEVSGFSTATFSTNSTHAAASSHCNSTISSATTASNAENVIVKLANSISNHSLLIDTRQLSDPDLLWRRKKYKSLSLGTMSPVGRFYTEVEPYPDKKTESRFSKAVKKFVNMEEDQAKEEFAWQIAAMIIEEVCSLTKAVPSDESITAYHQPTGQTQS